MSLLYIPTLLYYFIENTLIIKLLSKLKLILQTLIFVLQCDMTMLLKKKK